jgi:hypothetical protein
MSPRQVWIHPIEGRKMNDLITLFLNNLIAKKIKNLKDLYGPLYKTINLIEQL